MRNNRRLRKTKSVSSLSIYIIINDLLFQPSEASETKIQLPGLEDLDEPPAKRLRERIRIDVDK